MNVLSVNTNDSHGGAARAAMRIMQGVQQHGVETQMLVKEQHTRDTAVVSLHQFLPKNKLYRIADWVAQKLKNKYYHWLWRPYRKTKENVFMSDSRGTRLGGALQKLDYDVLHLHWINQRFLDLRELKRLNKPIVWTLHDSWPFCGLCHYFLDCKRYQSHCGDCPFLHSYKEKDLAYKVFEQKIKTYQGLNLHIVTPSKWLGECAKQSVLFGKFPVTVIPNCLDTNLYRPLSVNELKQNLALAIAQNQVFSTIERIVAEKSTKPMIFFGAVNAATDKIKGFANLLEALKILDAQGLEANLVVFGANDSNLPLQLEHITVHFVGYVSDTSTLVILYNLADVMVVPSWTENLSCAIMESLSCATPVCCFNVGGNSDMVEHKVSGYLAREKDSEDLAEGIRWCLENNGDNSLSKAAREKVMKEYTIVKVGGMYKELYEKIRQETKG